MTFNLESLFGLIPLIAVGVNQFHADKPLNSKIQYAQDALALATAGAQTLLPENEKMAAGQIGTLASQSITAFVTLLHNNSQATATVAVAPAPTVSTQPVTVNVPIPATENTKQ